MERGKERAKHESPAKPRSGGDNDVGGEDLGPFSTSSEDDDMPLSE